MPVDRKSIHSYENLRDIRCACVIFRCGICLKYFQKIELLAVDFGETVWQCASLSNVLLELAGYFLQFSFSFGLSSGFLLLKKNEIIVLTHRESDSATVTFRSLHREMHFLALDTRGMIWICEHQLHAWEESKCLENSRVICTKMINTLQHKTGMPFKKKITQFNSGQFSLVSFG